jgi:hypothetical protein
MDLELRQYLDAKFARIDQRFDRIIGEPSAERPTLQTMEDRLLARIDKFEATLLNAFRGGTRPMSCEERLALAEQRISELERKRAS